MLVFFSGRHIKPGHWEQFREAWGGGDEDLSDMPEGTVIYHARNVKDEDEVISFGIFDVGRESIDAIRSDAESEAKRREEMDKHVKDIPLEGIYEVVEEIRP
jgi:heme-degrading monooxygenase HmoA